MAERLHGILIFWRLSKSGGFGLIQTGPPNGLYFLHGKRILSGRPLPGGRVTFTPLPKLADDEHPKATEAIITESKR